MRIGNSPSLALLSIDRQAPQPLHQQLSERLRRAIVDGMLRARQRLPSSRTLAEELGISRFTVLTAYEQLTDEGYVTGRKGSGTYVSAGLPESKLLLAPPAGRDEGGLRPFRVSATALDRFPHALWARLVARHAHRLAPSHMAYGDPAGLGQLRAAIAQYLRTARAVRCEADQVIVVSGSQAALAIAAAAALTGGDVAIEEPGYRLARAALQTAGAEVVPVPVDDHGLSVSALHALGPRTRGAYVTPSHQYPLGIVMSAARRLALVEWARLHDAWLIEDDYDSEFRYDGQPLGSIQGMDSSGRVIYVGTFSKVMFPAIRVGYVVAPPTLRDAMLEAREALDVCSPTLYQLALLDFIREEHFARHLRRMREVYARRRQALLTGLARHCGDKLAVPNANAGLHVAALLLDESDDAAIIRRMAQRGFTATALSTCYAGPNRRNGLLLGFAGSDEATLERASQQLGEILEQRT